MQPTDEQITEFENLLRLLTSKEEEQVLLGLQLRRGVNNPLLEKLLADTFDFLSEQRFDFVIKSGYTYASFIKKRIEKQLVILQAISNKWLYDRLMFNLDKVMNLSLISNALDNFTVRILENIGLTDLGKLHIAKKVRVLHVSNNKIPILCAPITHSLYLYNCHVREIASATFRDAIYITHSTSLDENTLANMNVWGECMTMDINLTASNILFGDGLIAFLRKNMLTKHFIRRITINITDTPVLRSKKTFYAFLKKLYLLLCELQANLENDTKNIWRNGKWSAFERGNNFMSLVVGSSYNEKKIGGLFSLMSEFGIYISKEYE